MHIRSIRVTMALVFVALMLLGGLSVGVSLWTARAQQHDALILNLAGRQRMLSQKTAKEVWVALQKDQDPRHLARMHTTAHQFGEGLRALMDGGQVTYAGRTVSVPPAADPAFRAALEEVRTTWESFHQAAQAVTSAALSTRLESGSSSPAFTQGAEDPLAVPRQAQDDSSGQALERLSDVILKDMDAAVRVYQVAAEARVARLRWIQLAFLAAGGLVLALGYGLMLIQVLRPVSALETAVRQVERGDLDPPHSGACPQRVGPAGAGSRRYAAQLGCFAGGVGALGCRVG